VAAGVENMHANCARRRHVLSENIFQHGSFTAGKYIKSSNNMAHPFIYKIKLFPIWEGASFSTLSNKSFCEM
jgi:hypothetical protein